jgi:hypothetical protein
MSEHASVQGLKRKMYYERVNPKASYPSGTGGEQNHHILPCTSVKKSLFKAAEKKDNLIKAVKYFTEWNINVDKNLKMLPTTKWYQKRFGKRGGKQGPIPADDRPCHNWGHKIYNEKVGTALMSVWSQVVITLDVHKLDDATDIAGELENKRSDWEDKVTGRSGTLANWKAMYDGTPGAHNHFTMAKMPTSPV